MKDALYKEEGRVRGLVEQVNKLSSRMEDLFDENAKLRKAAGLGDADKVDIKDVRLQKEAQITQLRSLNALLERQVGGGGITCRRCVHNRCIPPPPPSSGC